MMVAPKISIMAGCPMVAKTLSGAMTPRKPKIGTAMSEVTGSGKTSVIHQSMSQTHPARQTMPSGFIPSSGGRSFRRKQRSGPRAKKAICLQSAGVAGTDMAAPRV